jgi:transcription-repair coupling factor (superfamily II helicase)
VADSRDDEQAAKVRAELADRYGPPPEAVGTLIDFALLKSQAEQLGIEVIERRGGALNIKFHPGSKIQPEKLMALVGAHQGAQFTPAGVLRLPLEAGAEGPAAVLESLRESLAALR